MSATTIPENVELREDVVYGRGGERELKLDLYLPRNDAEKRPAVVFIHGGGWKGGNRGQFRSQSLHLASNGYVCACIEYRLSGEARFPAAIEDAKCAVRFMRANAEELRVDPDRIAAAGGSAGGHLAALVGASDAAAELEGTGGHAEFSSRVNLVIPFNGVFDFAAMAKAKRAVPQIGAFIGGTYEEMPHAYAKASPITYADKSDPPFLLLHGSADQTVPFKQSVRMQKRLQEVGVEAELFEADGAGHGFFNRPPWYEPTLKRMEEFLERHFRAGGSP